MNCGEDRDGSLGDVDTGEDVGCFCYSGKTLVDDFCEEVGEWEVDVVFSRAAASSFFDFHVHGSGDYISRCEVLRYGCPMNLSPLPFRR